MFGLGKHLVMEGEVKCVCNINTKINIRLRNEEKLVTLHKGYIEVNTQTCQVRINPLIKEDVMAHLTGLRIIII